MRRRSVVSGGAVQIKSDSYVPNVGITNELSKRISYYVCTFDDVSYVVCCVVVATPPVQVPLTQEHQNNESVSLYQR